MNVNYERQENEEVKTKLRLPATYSTARGRECATLSARLCLCVVWEDAQELSKLTITTQVFEERGNADRPDEGLRTIVVHAIRMGDEEGDEGHSVAKGARLADEIETRNNNQHKVTNQGT